jgi:hypothetical protein
MRFTLLSALCLLLSTGTAFAASDTIHHHAAAPEHAYYGETLTALGVTDSSTVTTGESLSAMFSMGKNWIHTLLAVYQTKGNFDFAVGGIYKFTVAGTRANGFHVGPGFTVGTVADDFAFAIFGAAGGHFTIADHLLFSVDAGPMVTHTKDNTNLRIRGLGQLLGASVHYVF